MWAVKESDGSFTALLSVVRCRLQRAAAPGEDPVVVAGIQVADAYLTAVAAAGGGVDEIAAAQVDTHVVRHV